MPKTKTKKLTADQKLIAKLTKDLENAGVVLAQEQHDKKYWERRFHEANEKLKNENVLDGKKLGHDNASMDVRLNAIVAAHKEVYSVKPTEQDIKILQRVIGAVQGILGLAVGTLHGHIPVTEIYPQDNLRAERINNLRNELSFLESNLPLRDRNY